MSDIDYEGVEIDADKSRADYHYTERRAAILHELRDAGHPRAFTQRQLASKYDVSVSTINNNMNALAEYIDNSLGDRRAFVSDLVFQKAIKELLDDREWRDAAKTAAAWNELVSEYKELQELEERLEKLEGRDL